MCDLNASFIFFEKLFQQEYILKLNNEEVLLLQKVIIDTMNKKNIHDCNINNFEDALRI